MRHKRTLGPRLFCVAVMLVALMLVAWRQAAPPNRARAFPAGAIVIGVDGSYQPFALDDGETLRGLDIDLAQALAAEIGLPAHFRNIGFYGLYDALISGEVDLLIAALRVDPARMDDVRYSQPYFDNGLLLVTALNAPIPTDADLQGKGVAYEYASSADSQSRAWQEAGRQIERRPYEMPAYALDALRLGQADAALVDAISYRLYQSEHSDWLSAARYISHEPYAIAIRQDRREAWKLVEGALSALKEGGELATIIDKWL